MNRARRSTVGWPGRRAALLAGALALAGCGGGGDAGTGTSGVGEVASGSSGGGSGAQGTGAAATAVAVSSAVATGMYGQPALITVAGTALDQGVTVSSPTCTGMALSTTAPWVSTATTAYYRCRTTGLGDHRVTVARGSDGATLIDVPFTVPAPQVTLKVSNGAFLNGDVVLTLAPDRAPITVDNFLAYVQARFYDGTLLHRVVRDQLAQGGGFVPGPAGTAPVQKTAGAPIELEVGKGLSNVQWSIGMARALAPNTATSQFYVNLVDNSAQLDPTTGSAGYAVFGVVEAGRTLLAAIGANACPTVRDCRPSPDVVITSALQTR